MNPGPGAAAAPAGWAPVFTVALHPPFGDDPVYGIAALRFADLSLRQFVPLPQRDPPGPLRLRLRLSNEFGDGALHIGELRLAWRAGRRGASTRAGSDRAVLFSGRDSVVIPPGQTLLSDPVALPRRGLEAHRAGAADLAVSVYLPQPTPVASWHQVGSRSSYHSTPGRHVRASRFPVAASGRALWFLAAVERAVVQPAPVWVAFGDSITDGAWHAVDADASWPLRWATAWARRSGDWPGVLNAGLSGNRLLGLAGGPSGTARFARDVLGLAGVQGVVLSLGINDLADAAAAGQALARVERLIGGLTGLSVRARQQGLRVVAGTLLPVAGSVHDRPGIEAARQRLNHWIRQTVAFDAVVDFDALLRDPSRPAGIRRDWTSDALHPNDAGYEVMARGVLEVLDAAGLAGPPR